jgi:hypothetical protein
MATGDSETLNKPNEWLTINIMKETPRKIRFKIISKTVGGYGVLEYYENLAGSKNTWHIELMNVAPTRCGYGTIFLKEMITELKSRAVASCTTHPTTPEAMSFFKKNGFTPIADSCMWILSF